MKIFARRTLIIQAVIAIVSSVIFGVFFMSPKTCSYALTGEATIELTAETGVTKSGIEIAFENIESDESKDVIKEMFIKLEGGLSTLIILVIVIGILFITVVVLLILLKYKKSSVSYNTAGSMPAKTRRKKRRRIALMQHANNIENNNELNEEVRFVIKNKGNYYGKIKEHVNTLEGVKINGTNSSSEVLFKKNKIVRLIFKEDGIYAEFNVTAKERKSLLPIGVKEATSVLKINDESAMTRTIGIIDRNYKSLS